MNLNELTREQELLLEAREALIPFMAVIGWEEAQPGLFVPLLNPPAKVVLQIDKLSAL
jgi:hypothetical protein